MSRNNSEHPIEQSHSNNLGSKQTELKTEPNDAPESKTLSASILPLAPVHHTKDSKEETTGLIQEYNLWDGFYGIRNRNNR